MTRGRTSYGPGRLWKREQAGGDVWVLDWRDERGVRRRDHLGPNKREAEEVRTELIARRNRRMRGLEVETQDIALDELRDRYLADLGTRASARHVRNVEIHLRHVLEGLQPRTLNALKAHHVLDFRAALIRAGAQNRTANAHLQSFKAMISWAVKAGLATAHPLQGLKGLPDGRAHQRYRRRALSETDIERFLAAAEAEDAALATQGPRVPQAPMWQTLLDTGVRYGEMRQLRWCDFDAGRGVLVVRAETAKAGVSRQIPLRDELRERLVRLRSVNALVLGRALTAGDALFLSPRGKPWCAPSNNVRRCLHRLLLAAGIKRYDELGEQIDVHALRHCFVSRLARAGVPLIHAQRLAGHSDPKLTAQVYAHVEVEDLRGAVERLGLRPGEAAAARSAG